MVDLGISFGDETMPGVDVIMPDPAFIAERRDDLVGLVITHAHEDHLGAVQHLLPELRCPVSPPRSPLPYCARSCSRRVWWAGGDYRSAAVRPLHRWSVRCRTGQGDALGARAECAILRTPLGAALHTGDWKLDPSPVTGEPTDQAVLIRLGDEARWRWSATAPTPRCPGHLGPRRRSENSYRTIREV